MDLMPCFGGKAKNAWVTQAVEMVGIRNCGGKRNCCKQFWPTVAAIVAPTRVY